MTEGLDCSPLDPHLPAASSLLNWTGGFGKMKEGKAQVKARETRIKIDGTDAMGRKVRKIELVNNKFCA